MSASKANRSPGKGPNVQPGITTDGITVGGSGSKANPIAVINGGTQRQAWIYTASGEEGDSFTVDLPAEQVGAYGVIAQGQGLARFLSFDMPNGSKTPTSFLCNTSANLTVDDEIYFTVEALS